MASKKTPPIRQDAPPVATSPSSVATAVAPTTLVPPKATPAGKPRKPRRLSGNGIPGDPDEFTTAEERARPTKRSEAMYRRYEAMGQARTLKKLAEQITLEDWAAEHYYRQNRGESLDAFYRRLRKELEKAGNDAMEPFFRHRQWQLATLQRWSARYDWQNRVAAFDQEQADVLERETLMARIDMNKRQAAHAAVLHQMSGDRARKLIEGGELAGRDTVALFLGAATQERVALGASTSIQEQRGKLGLGVTQQGEVTVRQDVDVHGNVTVQHEHSGNVQVQVTQLNVDLLRLLQEAASPSGQASLQWRHALGLLAGPRNDHGDADTSPHPDTSHTDGPATSARPVYQSLGAWIVPPELAPNASQRATSAAQQPSQPPQLISPVADDSPLVVDSTPPPTPQHVALASSDLASASYDAATATLEIGFLSGATYRYSDVPPNVYDGLLAAESAGGYFHQCIRGQYPYERLPAAD